MLVFDQLKKDDPYLRFLAVIVAAGILILLTGLWWVQLVSTKYFQKTLENQSTRSVRIPAVRGKILDRNGRALAENRPVYSVDLYLEELSKNYQKAYNFAAGALQTNFSLQITAKQKQLGRKLTPQEKKQFTITEDLRNRLRQQTRYEVTSGLLADLSVKLQQPVSLTQSNFERWYEKSRVLPLPVLANLNPASVARFEEQSANIPGVDLEVQSVRFYPNGNTAAHLLGYLTHDDESRDDRNYNYRLPDYAGVSGIEGLFDEELHGEPGSRTVTINNYGFRQPESIDEPPTPGQNIVLTIDLDIQKAAESALENAQASVRGAVVVMDPQTGDVIAMASAPGFNPNHRIHPDPATQERENERWSDPQLGLQRNRAIYENYHPGSIFKMVVAMAGLEINAFDPHAEFHSEGYYQLGKRRIGDTAHAGEFDFNRAMAKSSNPYFIDLGLRPGVLQKMIALGHRLHLGERTEIARRQEARGNFPSEKRISSNWHDGDTANLSIGQGEIDVTPLQMAVVTSAVANGGKVFWPRVVERIENADGSEASVPYAPGRVRDNLGVSAHTLRVLHDGMLADTEDPEGSGHLLKIPGWRVAGKTGTAEVERNGRIDKSAKDTWFVSFAPEEKPRYVVVATVEGGASGGLTCVPIARDVYLALQQMERKASAKPALAQAR